MYAAALQWFLICNAKYIYFLKHSISHVILNNILAETSVLFDKVFLEKKNTKKLFP